MEHRQILVQCGCLLQKYQIRFLLLFCRYTYLQTNHRYNHPFNGRVYNAIITYRFRSQLLVLSMYRGNRSRINRTGNEFSVLEKRRKQSIGRAQMAWPDRPSFGHAHYVRVSVYPTHSFSIVRRIRCSLCYVTHLKYYQIFDDQF